ncbi:MAG TPA: phage tail protein, partial [Verrucomicrobiales bacterium]|nr:phage tail protein [Verrucomicrobiales bacterium]
MNGELQTVQLPEIPAPGVSAANFLVTLNGLLTGIGVTATLATNRLTLTTTRRGSTASIQVLAARLGFAEGASSTATDSNVADLAVVGFAEIRDRVAALNATLPEPVLEVIEVPGGRFALRTLLAASTARLAVGPVAGPAEVSPQALLGLPEAGPPGASGAGVAASFFQRSTVAGSGVWHVPGNTASPLVLGSLANRNLHLLSFSAEFVDADGASSLYEDLALGRDHPRFVGTLLAQNPTARADALAQPIWFGIGNNVNPLVLLTALFPARAVRVEDDRRVVTHSLTGGNDGVAPVVGAPTDPGTYAAAFELLRALEDVAIVAAPGHSDYPAAEAIRAALIAHAERPRAYRIAVLDPPPRQLPGGVQAYRAQIDSHRAALYYPWVTVPNPLSRPGRAGLPKEINLPPSAFICGIYARNDVEKGVSKAPANEVVRGALRFERDINFAQNQLLNPLGVNCLRYFPGRGYRVWGARTASSDPEWKYVNV